MSHLSTSVKAVFSFWFFLQLTACVTTQKNIEKTQTPSEVISQSLPSEWRSLSLQNTLYIQLETGVVVVEMAPQFAPRHVENTKKLIRQGLFDGTRFYRVLDGFVAQGGPIDGKEGQKLKEGSLTIPGEMTINTEQPMDFTVLEGQDGYADETGFVNGFAAGRTRNKKTNWLLHCYGAFAMGRANKTDSGGTELYVVIGPAQRYLDRNTTVFGRVVSGMEHLQKLQRSQNIYGAIDILENKILKIQVGVDMRPADRVSLEVMKTDTTSFKKLIAARKNRTGDWFIHRHDYIDACSIQVPVRLKNKEISEPL